MHLSQRAFSGETDRQAMVALARAFPRENLHVVDLPYRLSSWALDDPGNVRLWVDAAGRLQAWAVMQTPFWAIDYCLHPDAGPDLHGQLLTWADRRALQLLGAPGGHPCWFVMVLAGQTARMWDLEAAGFACQADMGEDSWSQVLLQRPAALPVADCALPTGFQLCPLTGEREVDAYVHLHRAAFGTENMTPEWRRRTLRCPEHEPDLDLVAVAPDGRLAAFCVCWCGSGSEQKPCGRIEPMGVHPDFRGLGLGRAILSEGLRRLVGRGADRIYVHTDKERSTALALYQAMGFRPIQDVLVYRKDYAAADG